MRYVLVMLGSLVGLVFVGSRLDAKEGGYVFYGRKFGS